MVKQRPNCPHQTELCLSHSQLDFNKAKLSTVVCISATQLYLSHRLGSNTSEAWKWDCWMLATICPISQHNTYYECFPCLYMYLQEWLSAVIFYISTATCTTTKASTLQYFHFMLWKYMYAQQSYVLHVQSCQQRSLFSACLLLAP